MYHWVSGFCRVCGRAVVGGVAEDYNAELTWYYIFGGCLIDTDKERGEGRYHSSVYNMDFLRVLIQDGLDFLRDELFEKMIKVDDIFSLTNECNLF